MRVKKVNRYYCDYCNKGGCSASAMKKHEKHCTMNPKRECGMCDALGVPQHDLEDLIPLLPNPTQYPQESEHGYLCINSQLISDVSQAIKTLMDVTEGCPICVFAALRQSGTLDYASTFHLKTELDKAWTEINNAEYEADMRSALYG